MVLDYDHVRDFLKNNFPDIQLLIKPNVLEWLYGDDVFIRTLTKESEKKFGSEIIDQETSQWTTSFGESLVNEILERLDENPLRIPSDVQKRGANNKKLNPDYITDKRVIEVKTRSYKIPGTAGEKTLGSCIKYIEVPRLYGKPLDIVCVGYQEKEADKDFMLFDTTIQSPELNYLLHMFAEKMQVRYIRATHLFEEVLAKLSYVGP